MKKILLITGLLSLATIAHSKIFEDYLNETDYQYLDLNSSCYGIGEDRFLDISDHCYDQVAEPIEDITPLQAQKKLKQYGQCFEKNGISKKTQKKCITSAKRGDDNQESFQAMANAFQQMANNRGTQQITLPLPPKSQLVNHMYPEDLGGKFGNMEIVLASAVFQSDISIQEMAAYYRSKVGKFLEYRHSNGDISFIKGAGKEVRKPAALLKAQMEKPNIQISKKMNMMTGKPMKGSQVILFYKR